MRIVELILDEEQEIGIEAISVVENPAIEEDFIALKSQEFKLAEVDKEKRILMGALLIPNKPIYRRNGEDEYYIYFSKDTVLKASQMYLMQGKQNNSTFLIELIYGIQLLCFFKFTNSRYLVLSTFNLTPCCQRELHTWWRVCIGKTQKRSCNI